MTQLPAEGVTATQDSPMRRMGCLLVNAAWSCLHTATQQHRVGVRAASPQADHPSIFAADQRPQGCGCLLQHLWWRLRLPTRLMERCSIIFLMVIWSFCCSPGAKQQPQHIHAGNSGTFWYKECAAVLTQSVLTQVSLSQTPTAAVRASLSG